MLLAKQSIPVHLKVFSAFRILHVLRINGTVYYIYCHQEEEYDIHTSRPFYL